MMMTWLSILGSKVVSRSIPDAASWKKRVLKKELSSVEFSIIFGQIILSNDSYQDPGTGHFITCTTTETTTGHSEVRKLVLGRKCPIQRYKFLGLPKLPDPFSGVYSFPSNGY